MTAKQWFQVEVELDVCFHTLTVFYQVQPRLGTVISRSLKRIRETRPIGQEKFALLVLLNKLATNLGDLIKIILSNIFVLIALHSI
jgi:hypothetical protein